MITLDKAAHKYGLPIEVTDSRGCTYHIAYQESPNVYAGDNVLHMWEYGQDTVKDYGYPEPTFPGHLKVDVVLN